VDRSNGPPGVAARVCPRGAAEGSVRVQAYVTHGPLTLMTLANTGAKAQAPVLTMPTN